MIEHADHRLSSLRLELEVGPNFTSMLLYYLCMTVYVFVGGESAMLICTICWGRQTLLWSMPFGDTKWS